MALPRPRLRTCLAAARYAAGTALVASMTSAWYYRPIADDDDGNGSGGGGDGRREFFRGPHASPPWSREEVPTLLAWARRFSIGVTTVAIRLLMNTYGSYDIEDDARYRAFLRAVLERGDGSRRAEGRGLLTVSNHRSLFDDPGVVSCLLPLPAAVQPRYNRWAVCSQEYCFADALPAAIRGYIGAGQVLPIRRGGGIDQAPLRHFARHLARGEWCHVFPEGGVWQWDALGGRREVPPGAVRASSSDFGDAGAVATNDVDGGGGGTAPVRIVNATRRQRALPPSPRGKLKWGVGKLVAHAPIVPVVMPFAHRGMERLLPQDEDTGRTRLRDGALLGGLLPAALGGDADDDRLRVRIRFGDEITFDDLIAEHESEHGRLWKYGGRADDDDDDGGGGGGGPWESSPAERALYSKIARRIEERLDALTREVCAEERTG